MRLDTCGYRGHGDCSQEQLPGARYCTAHSHPIEMTLGLREVSHGDPEPTDSRRTRVLRGVAIMAMAITIAVVAVLALVWLS